MATPTKTPINSRMEAVLAAIKEEFGDNKTAIAKEIGISQPSLSQLVSGASKAPSRQTLKLLYMKYGVNPIHVLEGSPGMFDPLKEVEEPAPIGLVEMLRSIPPERLLQINRENPAKISERIDPLEARIKALEQSQANFQEIVSLLREVNQSQSRRIELLEKEVESLKGE